MNLYLRILNYVKPYKHILAAALLCTVLAAAGNLYLPWIIKDMVDKVLSEKDSMMLNLIALSIVVIFIARGIFYLGRIT